jgi:hypothetical protein
MDERQVTMVQSGSYVATNLSSKELYYCDIGSAVLFDEDELNMFLVDTLETVKLAFCRHYMQRISTLTDLTISFMIDNLGSSDLAK